VPVPVPGVPWSGLKIGETLGEGASGRISRVQSLDGGSAWALKLFKGAVTSDGLPEHELAGSLVAGGHPALCTPVAELSGHPEGTPGLLLPLIPVGYVHLAGPPSLESCTRDVYAEGWRIGATLALRLARTVVSAVAHLHRQGVMHGDLYAHNILWNPDSGDGLLGDFGAATLLPTDQPVQRRALLALEVRALGCLLDEMAMQARRGAGDEAVWTALDGLARACLDLEPARRPTLDDVERALGQVAGY
jgi:serine/threonine protein kinase